MRMISPISLGLTVLLCGCPVITDGMVQGKIGGVSDTAVGEGTRIPMPMRTQTRTQTKTETVCQ